MFCIFGRNFENLDNLNLYIATMKGYKHHSASRWICKHFIRSCKTGVIK